MEMDIVSSPACTDVLTVYLRVLVDLMYKSNSILS